MNDQKQTTCEWRPSDPVGRLQWLYTEHCIKVNHTLARGCRCGSCLTFCISWEDNDVEHTVEHEMLVSAIAVAWHALEGSQQ